MANESKFYAPLMCAIGIKFKIGSRRIGVEKCAVNNVSSKLQLHLSNNYIWAEYVTERIKGLITRILCLFGFKLSVSSNTSSALLWPR